MKRDEISWRSKVLDNHIRNSNRGLGGSKSYTGGTASGSSVGAGFSEGSLNKTALLVLARRFVVQAVQKPFLAERVS